MTDPFPFKTIATGIAYSLFLEANFHESTRIAAMLVARIVLIHVGEKSARHEAELNRILEGTGSVQNNVEVIWKTGGPVKTILSML